MKLDPDFDKMSCLSWFYESFYDRLFDVHPSSRVQFKQNIIVQGKALVNMISACLSLLNKPTELVKVLENMAKMHTSRGVMAHQYGVVGECLLWTFDHCLGDEFTEDSKVGWIRIYSFMIDVIIPVALKEERKLMNDAKKVDKNVKSLSRQNSERTINNSVSSPGRS
jgi:hemoglobin-like flavoprotein